MKMSIKTRLFLGITFLITFFVACSWLLNSQFLSKYYVSKKKHSLLKSNQMINQLYEGNPLLISFELESLERNRGLNITFLAPDFELKYNSSFRLSDSRFIRRPNERIALIYPIQPKLLNLDIGDFIIDVVKDPRLKTNFLMLASRLNNGDLLLLSTPLVAIDESTDIANRFLLFTGLITIFLGGIVVFLFANRFTKPILELNDIAQRMSKLDFSKKYSIRTEDEIGQLGSSINSLSEQLDISISELKAVNDKLVEDIERERRIDTMRKEFISNVSHELKTPIALIQGYAEGLKLNVNEDTENRDFYCEVIMDEADKMNRLVKDLLDLSQIESGYFKLEKTVFNISSLIDYVLGKYRPIILEKAIDLDFNKDQNIKVEGDMVRIEQVLINYLNNGINHVDEQKKIKINVAAVKDKVRVSIYNSGKNIPEASLDKIWTSFYKVDKARTRAYGGTGLGLSVVRVIQELHHNGFGVENNEDGVTFWFDLDMA